MSRANIASSGRRADRVEPRDGMRFDMNTVQASNASGHNLQGVESFGICNSGREMLDNDGHRM
jgi:hypothetical protein